MTENQLWQTESVNLFIACDLRKMCVGSVSSCSSVCPEDVKVHLPVILSLLAVTFNGIHIQLFPSQCFCFHWSNYYMKVCFKLQLHFPPDHHR